MRTEDEYRDTDLLPSQIRDVTIKLARIDRARVVEILDRFHVKNIVNLRVGQLRAYYEAVWSALVDGAVPTQQEWEEHSRAFPRAHGRVQAQIYQMRRDKEQSRWEIFP